MKIFVCVKQVPDTETKIKLKADAGGIETAGVKWVMNPYDEFAVEEALKLREAGKATHVTVVGLGPKGRVIDSLRTALAMGADDAIVIDANEDVDVATTAKGLAAAILAEGDFKLVLTGKLAIDDNASAVSQMIAEHLKVPHATVVSKLDVTDSNVIAEREVEGGYASLPGIMKAKKKPVKELTLESLGVTSADQKTRFKNFQTPPEKPAVYMIAGDALSQSSALVRMLREDVKVI